MNELTLPGNNEIPSSVSTEVVTQKAFTTRLQMVHSLSKIMQEWKSEQGRKPEEGQFWLGPPGTVNLGNCFFAIPIATRSHALCIRGGEVHEESFNAPAKGSPPKSKEEEIFLEIKGRDKQVKERKEINYVGGDVLFWLPPAQHYSVQGSKEVPYNPNNVFEDYHPNGCYAIYFFNSTAAPVAEKAAGFRGKLVVVKRGADGKSAQFTWPLPEMFAFPGTLDPTDSFHQKLAIIPSQDSIKDEMTKFLNPAKPGAKAEGVDGRPR